MASNDTRYAPLQVSSRSAIFLESSVETAPLSAISAATSWRCCVTAFWRAAGKTLMRESPASSAYQWVSGRFSDRYSVVGCGV